MRQDGAVSTRSASRPTPRRTLPVGPSPRRRAALVGAAACVGTLTAGCASEPSEPDDPFAEQRAAGPADAGCPVTSPMPPDRYPRALLEEGTTTWYGQGRLWVDLAGLVDAGQVGDAVRADHAWWTLDASGEATLADGPPSVRATRLDGPGRVAATVSGRSDDRSASWPTRLTLPGPGCWLVTGELDGTAVRAVVRAR